MKRTCTTIIAIASLTLLSACGLAPEEKLAEAEASFAANDYAGAKVYLVSALKEKPGDEAMLVLLAKTQIAMGDGEGALASLERLPVGKRPGILVGEAELLRGRPEAALTAIGDPQTADAVRIAALAHLALGDIDAATASIAAGENLDGDQAGLLAVLARIELGKGDNAAAREAAKRALEADDQSLDALLASALVNKTANDLPATLGAYEKAARIYPQSFAAQLGRVATLGDMGQIEEAREGIERLSEMAPKSIDVIHLKARLAIEERKWEKAREILQGHEAELHGDPSMQATYATALLRVGQSGQARAWLEPLVEEFPGSRKPRTLLAEAQLASGDPRAALETVRPLAERPDASPEELSIAAKAAKAAGDPSSGRFADREATSTPEWIGGELAKADTALRNRQWSKAVESYEAINARSASPNAMVLNNLAFAKSKLGENEDAIRIALKAVELAPDHPAVLDTAGWLLVETGSDRSRGLAMLEKAARLDPDNTAIAQRLAAAKRG